MSIYTCNITTPLGEIAVSAEDSALTGLWFIGQKYYPGDTGAWQTDPDYPVFARLRLWLEGYFAGKNPAVDFPLAPRGSAFRQRVWRALSDIPYGDTATYGGIAKGLDMPSAQAVGGAVGHNPISIVIPCHRVVGASGSLTGYAGGLERKRALLKLEGG